MVNRFHLAILAFSMAFFGLNAAPLKAVMPSQDHWRQISVEGKQLPVVYRAAIGPMIGAAIIIQERQKARLYEYSAVKALREKLPNNGWATLGINIPHQGKVSNIPAEKQLEQAVLMLKNEGVAIAYVIQYGASADNLFEHFIEHSVRNINGIVLISSYSQNSESYKMLVNGISTWGMFVFDLVAQFDYDYVLKDFSLRKKFFEQVPSYYRSLQLPGAEAGYEDSSVALVRWVRGWMVRQANKKPVVDRPDGLIQVPLSTS